MKKSLEQIVFEGIKNKRVERLLGYIEDVAMSINDYFDVIFKQHDSDCKERAECSNCSNAFLYIIRNENVESILHKGIISNIQNLKKTRLILKDCYGKELDKKLIDIMHALDIKDSDFDKYTILEIYAGGRDNPILLYKDLSMGRDDCCFTYETIQPEQIGIYKKM